LKTEKLLNKKKEISALLLWCVINVEKSENDCYYWIYSVY